MKKSIIGVPKRTALRLSWLAVVASLFLAGASSLYGQWITGYYAAQNGVLSIPNIPWNLYTHVVHFAASTPGDGTVSLYYLTQAEINTLISARPAGKKVLACIKDNDSNYNLFPQSASAGTIATFVNNIVNFVNSNGYDGVDIDWEKNVNTTQFVDLMNRLRSAMPTKVITMAGNPGTAAGAAGSQASLDQVNVMCYDLDWGDSFSWYNDALLQSGNQNVLTCDWDVAQFTGAGVAAAKIGVGMPFYGRRWPGATQALQTDSFNRATTFLYRDLVNDATRWQPQYQFYDNTYKSNYLSIPSLNEFDSYNGTQFINDLVPWQKANGFGGFMTYSLDYEYLSSQVGDAAHPLSAALYNAVSGVPPPPPPPSGPVISAVSASSITSSSAIIGWTTNVPADSQVDYGTTTAYGLSTALDGTLVTSHSQALSSLQRHTTYHYRVKSRDSLGNLTVSGDSTFNTRPGHN